MIETYRVPNGAVIAPTIPPAARTFRPQPKVFRGAPPTELEPGEKTALAEQRRVWLPVIPAERKRALLELHRALAEAWTAELGSSLRRGEEVRLSGLTFETTDQLAAKQADGSSAVLLGVEGTRMAGCVLVGGRLLARLARPGIETEADETTGGGSHLTRLETTIARRAIAQLVAQFSASYARAGVGTLRASARGEGLTDTPLFGPQDYLAVFRYTIGEAEHDLSLTVAVNLELVRAVRADPGAARDASGSVRVRQLAAAVPVQAAIVLGGWRVPLSELAALAAGDELILPEGDEARLEVAGVAIRRVRIEVAGATMRARVESR